VTEPPKMCPKCGHRCTAPTKVLGDERCDHCKALIEERRKLMRLLDELLGLLRESR